MISQGTLYTWFLVLRRALLCFLPASAGFSLKTELTDITACTPPLTLWHVRLLFLSLSMILWLHHAVFLDFRLSLISLRASWFLSPQCLGNIWHTGDAPSVLTNWWLASSFERSRFMAKMTILKTNQIYVLVLNNLCYICKELTLIHIL